MLVTERPLEALKPYLGNPRKNAGAVAAVAESIRRFGFRQPLVVDGDGVIVCGHTRFEAAKSLKMTTVPCVSAEDLSPEAIRAYRLLDNKLHEKSSWDYDALVLELSDLDYDFSAFDVSFEPPPSFLDGEADADGSSSSSEPSLDGGADAIPSVFELVVRCGDEEEQRALFERLVSEGYNVRLCNLKGDA